MAFAVPPATRPQPRHPHRPHPGRRHHLRARPLNRLRAPPQPIPHGGSTKSRTPVSPSKIRDVKKALRLAAGHVQTTALPTETRQLCYIVHL
jgi:hypothetical protein